MHEQLKLLKINPNHPNYNSIKDTSESITYVTTLIRDFRKERNKKILSFFNILGTVFLPYLLTISFSLFILLLINLLLSITISFIRYNQDISSLTCKNKLMVDKINEMGINIKIPKRTFLNRVLDFF